MDPNLADVLLLVIAVKGFIALELAPNIGQFFIDSFGFGLKSVWNFEN